VTPQAWVRYWKAGWVIGPLVALVGVLDRDLRLVFLGVVLVFVTFGMGAFWQQKAGGADHEPTSGEQ